MNFFIVDNVMIHKSSIDST